MAGNPPGTQTGVPGAAGQAAAAHASAPMVALDAFPDLTKVTSYDALLTLAESVAKQVSELIPTEAKVEEA